MKKERKCQYEINKSIERASGMASKRKYENNKQPAWWHRKENGAKNIGNISEILCGNEKPNNNENMKRKYEEMANERNERR